MKRMWNLALIFSCIIPKIGVAESEVAGAFAAAAGIIGSSLAAIAQSNKDLEASIHFDNTSATIAAGQKQVALDTNAKTQEILRYQTDAAKQIALSQEKTKQENKSNELNLLAYVMSLSADLNRQRAQYQFQLQSQQMDLENKKFLLAARLQEQQDSQMLFLMQQRIEDLKRQAQQNQVASAVIDNSASPVPSPAQAAVLGTTSGTGIGATTAVRSAWGGGSQFHARRGISSGSRLRNRAFSTGSANSELQTH